MPSVYELDAEPETLLGDDNASEFSESLLDESVSFIRPRDRPKKKNPIVSRTAGFITLLIVVVVFSVALSSSLRKRGRKLPGRIRNNCLIWRREIDHMLSSL
jgi:hypothetical protein